MDEQVLDWMPGSLAPDEALVGALMRWREVPRGRFQYGYYRGKQDGIHTFSLTPTGPINIWRVWAPVQVAVVRRSPDLETGEQ